MPCASQATNSLGMRVQGLKEHADDPAFQKEWRRVKGIAKEAAMRKITELCGVQAWAPNPDVALTLAFKETCNNMQQLLCALGLNPGHNCCA